MGTNGNDGATVDQRHLPGPELASADDRIVHVGHRHARDGAGNYILAAVRQYDLTAPLQRDAGPRDLQVRLVASGIKGDNSRVVDDPAQRQHGAVTDYHRPGIVQRRRLIEHEVAGTQRPCRHTVERDRLVCCQRNYRIAGAVLRQVPLHIIEIGESREAYEIDLIRVRIEAVDCIWTDWLRDHEHVLAGRAGQEILPRPGENRRADWIGLDVVRDRTGHNAPVGLRPGLGHIEQRRASEVRRRRDCQRPRIVRLYCPGAILEKGTAVQSPARWYVRDCNRYEGAKLCRRRGQA